MNRNEKLSTRQQKIDFLKALQEGKIDLKQLFPVPPFGMVIFENNCYRFGDGRIMNETEFKRFISTYSDKNDTNIYGMIIK